MEPRAWVNQLMFSDGSSFDLEKDDIVIIVGPNNSGKSAALRGVRDKFSQPTAGSAVINSISVLREGSPDDLMDWLEKTTKRIDQPNLDHTYHSFGVGVHRSQAASVWQNHNKPMGELSRFFCRLLTADERLQAANPANSIAITREAPSHPIHFLQRDDALEAKISRQFRRAFGVDLVVHRNAGSQVPLHVGVKPEPKSGEDRVSIGYILELEKLPAIQDQGDGMRSFAGVLLYTSVGRQTTLLVDEPEAFLHPPQARLLGKMMVIDKPADRQLFIATHSDDILRGVLDSNSSNVRVIRLRRKENLNIARELSNIRIQELWKDPLLRYSNILDGLFHEKVVLCESDSDCRFYAAVMDAIHEARNPEARRPDIMFTHCGGKARLPLVIRSLRGLDVPVAVVVDFDVLSEEHPLRDIYETAGGDWNLIAADWRVIKQAIDAKKPELSTDEIKREIVKELDSITSITFPNPTKQKIQSILRRSSPWSQAKETGIAFVPNGQPSQACKRLLSQLSECSIFVVPVGELEGFAKSVGGHGPSWVNEVIKMDLATEPELQAARDFAASLE